MTAPSWRGGATAPPVRPLQPPPPFSSLEDGCALPCGAFPRGVASPAGMFRPAVFAERRAEWPAHSVRLGVPRGRLDGSRPLEVATPLSCAVRALLHPASVRDVAGTSPPLMVVAGWPVARMPTRLCQSPPRLSTGWAPAQWAVVPPPLPTAQQLLPSWFRSTPDPGAAVPCASAASRG